MKVLFNEMKNCRKGVTEKRTIKPLVYCYTKNIVITTSVGSSFEFSSVCNADCY